MPRTSPRRSDASRSHPRAILLAALLAALLGVPRARLARAEGPPHPPGGMTMMSPRPTPAEAPLDIVIRGARVVDGTGAPWFRADVGIREGRIARIGRIRPRAGDREIDARGLILAPGFVDMMGQTATPLLDDPRTAWNLITQGVTTINAGEGTSAAPLVGAKALRRGWSTFAEYFQLLESRGLPVNVAQSVGHTEVRRAILGEGNRSPEPDELARMQDLVREAMRDGAIGLSTALIYPPAVYAKTDELVALASAAAEHGGRYYTHLRNEGDRLLEAIDEALEIGRAAPSAVHIFHLKAAGRGNWGKMQLAIARIRAARAEGLEVTADVYPYVHNGLGMGSFIHPRHFAEGREALLSRLDDPDLRARIREELETSEGWENWYRHVGGDWGRVVVGQSTDPRYSRLAGRSVAGVAEALGEDPWTSFFHLVRARAFALPESMSEANKILAIRQDFVSFSTDVGPAGASRSTSHPRAFGSFPRLLSRYVRDLGAAPLERVIARASALATNEIGAHDRGRIAEGLAADLVLLDLERLADRATFAAPRETSEGVRYVLVNGRLVLDDGRPTGNLPGRVLRGPGYSTDGAPWEVATGRTEPELNGFDERMREFLRQHHVPGAALAVTDHGRLVLARGYGYADLATDEKVSPTSLFRIASLSKPITAVAILQLVEKGKLSLDAKVFEVLGEEFSLPEGDAIDARLRDITIRHLLEHRGGWDRGRSFDAMFQSVRFARKVGVPPPAGARDVIRAMLDVPLDFDPGERYAYSNYGYCLLGRVIEKVTGSPYEDHVREHVLAPLGIRSMQVGATRAEGRRPGEVRYYHPDRGPSVFAEDVGQPVPSPYGAWHLEAMDAHGGWIASAVDLARFASAFDDPASCPILRPSSVDAMYARPPGLAGHDERGEPTPTYYSLGWLNRVLGEGRQNHWHTGSLPGTATIMIRRHDGRNFILLLNTRVSPGHGHLGRTAESLLHAAADEVDRWPDHDRFGDFDRHVRLER